MRHRSSRILSVLLGIAAVLGQGCAPKQIDLAQRFAGRSAPLMGYVGAGTERIHYAKTGNPDGPVVLLIHGTPGDLRSLAEVFADPGLAARATLVTVDRLGWGLSGDGSPVASVERQARALCAILDAFPGPRPSVVIGHSYGGPVAAWLAAVEPARVGAVVLVSASIDPAEERTAWYQMVSRWWIVRWMVPGALRKADAEVIPLPDQLTTLGPRLASLKAPVYVLHGQDDKLVPVANADYVRRVLGHSPPVVEVIPDQGHFVPWENPERIVALAHRALDGLGVPPAPPVSPTPPHSP
jgi:pimeloyl-ACP methyl ester carboxylesterase